MVGLRSNALLPDLEYLNRAADAVQKALDAGAIHEAGQVFDRLLDALDVELVARGVLPAGQPALFDALLLAAQAKRELQLVPKEGNVDVESR